jgi:hypothetical protein
MKSRPDEAKARLLHEHVTSCANPTRAAGDVDGGRLIVIAID